ncbi:MAG: hypothetical protein AAFX02_07525 [Pseudomonadota bacterium]
MIVDEFIHISSSSYPATQAEINGADEQVFVGENLCRYLADKLTERGYETDFIMEDWGWWLGASKDATNLNVGVYSYYELNEPIDFAVTVRAEKTKRWIIWPFKSVSIIPQITRLRSDIEEILQSAPDTRIVSKRSEFPLYD